MREGNFEHTPYVLLANMVLLLAGPNSILKAYWSGLCTICSWA